MGKGDVHMSWILGQLPVGADAGVADLVLGLPAWERALIGVGIALLAVGLLVALWLAWRGGKGGGAALVREIERRQAGLYAFSREVEERLDVKLDRLEQLVRQADAVLRGFESRAGSATPSSLSGLRFDQTPDGATPTEASLDDITPAEREKVLTMGRAGKRPEVIAEAVRLRPGEVDLILRLHGGAGHSSRSA